MLFMQIMSSLKTHAPACAQLAQRAYEEACASLPVLPAGDRRPFFEQSLKALLEQPLSLIAQEEGQIVGYLAPWPPFAGAFGDCLGAFVPLHGAAFFGRDPEKTASFLLERWMEKGYAMGVTSYGISHYVNREDIFRTLCLSGFGLRCSDLMRRAGEMPVPDTGDLLCELPPERFGEAAPLENALNRHMGASPVFMPKPVYTPESFCKEALHDGLRVFAAYRGGEPVAHLTMGHGGETFVDDEEGIWHIKGMYCAPEVRGGVSHALLAFACSAVSRRDAAYIGVDCETLNPPAFRFWQKHFTPFTFSAVRRLDERLLPPR